MDPTTRRQSVLLLLGLMASSLTLTEILVRMSWSSPPIGILVACQLVVYTGLHELSHGIAASLLDIPIQTIMVGPPRLSRHLLAIGDTKVRISWLPLGVTMLFGWARLTRPRQIALAISGALVPFATWSAAGWTWHVILLTGLLSWIPSMADGQLLFSSAPPPKDPDILRDQNREVAITQFQTNGEIHGVSLDSRLRSLDAHSWVQFVSDRRRFEIAVTVLSHHDATGEILLRPEGAAYPLNRRTAVRHRARLSGILASDQGGIPILTQDISRVGTRLETETALTPGTVVSLQIHWKSLSWTHWARVLRCEQQNNTAWDVVAVWCQHQTS